MKKEKRQRLIKQFVKEYEIDKQATDLKQTIERFSM